MNGDSLGSSLRCTTDNAYVAYSGVVVSQQLNNQPAGLNYIYVQAPSRSMALKAMMPQSMADNVFSPGELLDVSGYLDSEHEMTNADGSQTWGDRVPHMTECSRSGSVTAPKPLLMKTNSVVGAWAEGELEQGAYHGSGLNNLGLYARVAGRITYIATEPSSGSISFFYVDDGCRLKDQSTHPIAGSAPAPNVGVRIVAPSWTANVAPAGFAVGAAVSVTGCTALELIGQGGDNGIAAIRLVDMRRVTVY